MTPGHRFGMLRILSVDATNNNRATVICDCGSTAEFFMSALLRGDNVDCGCSRPALIYFIRVHDCVKIGRCQPTQISGRFSLVQTNCPYEATVIRTLMGTRNTEQLFHRFFEPLHIRGEWFEFSETMLTIQPDAAANALPLLGSVSGVSEQE